MAWELKGNAGTDPASAFLGTTDGKSLSIQPGRGNVGIGTTKPDTRLNINSEAPEAQAVLAVSNKNADTRVGFWSGFNAGKNPPAIFYTHHLRFGAVKDFSAGSDFTEALRIMKDGKIAIGTEHPFGNSKVTIQAQDGLTINGFQPFITLRDSNASSLPCVLQSVAGGFAIIPHQGRNAPVVVNRTGQMGIGTAQPQQTLHVVGDAHIENTDAGTGIGLTVEARTNTALSVTTSALESAALFVTQGGAGALLSAAREMPRYFESRTAVTLRSGASRSPAMRALRTTSPASMRGTSLKGWPECRSGNGITRTIRPAFVTSARRLRTFRQLSN